MECDRPIGRPHYARPICLTPHPSSALTSLSYTDSLPLPSSRLPPSQSTPPHHHEPALREGGDYTW
jgi:hypothetical protein